jgi:sugar phosphate isomerase/epimerase
MKIAAQLMTVREFMKTPTDIYTTLKTLREIGYTAAQISFAFIGEIEIDLLKSYFDELDMKVCGTHIPYNRLINDTAALIDEHQRLGSPFIGLGAISGEHTEEGYKRFAEAIAAPAKMISDAGMKLTYHNHAFEFAKFSDTKTGMDILIDNTDPDTFKLLPDIYWLQLGGVVPSAFLRKHAERVAYVHYKDVKFYPGGKLDMTEIGNGNIDWAYMTKVCREIGVPYAAVEQDQNWTDGNGINSLAASYSHLKGIGLC